MAIIALMMETASTHKRINCLGKYFVLRKRMYQEDELHNEQLHNLYRSPTAVKSKEEMGEACSANGKV
jgi:hypothetical protein